MEFRVGLDASLWGGGGALPSSLDPLDPLALLLLNALECRPYVRPLSRRTRSSSAAEHPNSVTWTAARIAAASSQAVSSAYRKLGGQGRGKKALAMSGTEEPMLRERVKSDGDGDEKGD